MRIRLIAAMGLLAAAEIGAEERRPVPLYTNEDLRRVAPQRGDTGVLSQPALSPTTVTAAPRAAREGSPPCGEACWRARARKVAARIQALRDQAEELRARAEELKAQPRGRRKAVVNTAPLERRWQRLEERIRDEQAALEDDARRAGALPGWLR